LLKNQHSNATRLGFKPDYLLSSPAKRAIGTTQEIYMHTATAVILDIHEFTPTVPGDALKQLSNLLSPYFPFYLIKGCGHLLPVDVY